MRYTATWSGLGGTWTLEVRDATGTMVASTRTGVPAAGERPDSTVLLEAGFCSVPGGYWQEIDILPPLSDGGPDGKAEPGWEMAVLPLTQAFENELAAKRKRQDEQPG